jgi:lipoate-protein ligase A
MGPEQLALAFAISLKNGPLPPSIKGVFYTMTEILREGLSQFGLKAEFRPKNDLEIKGKKIAGLSAVIEKKDILLFHTSLLLDFDFELMIEVLNLPPVKMKDKGISCFTERMTTLKREMGRKVKLEEVMEVIKSAFERKLHLKLKADNFTERENREKKRLIKEKYTTQEWLYCVKIPSIKFGRAVRKTKAGLVQVDLTLSRGIIENIFITGDFLPENEKVIGQIESILKWSAAEKEKIKEKLTKVMEKDLIYNLTPSLLAEIITEAKENVSPSC